MLHKFVRAFAGREDATSKRAVKYYEKLIPFVYRNDRFGIMEALLSKGAYLSLFGA